MRFSIRLMAVIVRNDSYDGNKKKTASNAVISGY